MTQVTGRRTARIWTQYLGLLPTGNLSWDFVVTVPDYDQYLQVKTLRSMLLSCEISILHRSVRECEKRGAGRPAGWNARTGRADIAAPAHEDWRLV